MSKVKNMFEVNIKVTNRVKFVQGYQSFFYCLLPISGQILTLF